MSLKMSEFHGIDPTQVTKLHDAGIENTDDLMKVWSDKEQRPGLLTRTGIPEASFLKFASMARLGRVKGMEMKYVDGLIAAGIDGPKRLFSYTPETLAQHLSDMVTEKKVTGPIPTVVEITAWFANPRPGMNGDMESGSKPAVDTKLEGVVVH